MCLSIRQLPPCRARVNLNTHKAGAVVPWESNLEVTCSHLYLGVPSPHLKAGIIQVMITLGEGTPGDLLEGCLSQPGSLL